MRLTCPNCSARYEVDDSLIPPEGRDVQCSNCATTWFQPGNRARVEDPTPAPAGDGERSAPRRELDPALRDILREEREREETLRRAAAPVDEEQEEMALDRAPPPATRATDPEEPADAAADELATIRADLEAEARDGGRGPSGRDLLPDIEEINSTLRATTDRDAGEFRTTDIESMDLRPRRRRGFRVGFMLMILLAAAAVGAYAYAPLIADAVPQAGPYLAQYVDQVNELRVWLDGLVQSLADQLAARAGS